jgi:hypothetical protein
MPRTSAPKARKRTVSLTIDPGLNAETLGRDRAVAPPALRSPFAEIVALPRFKECSG